MCNMNSMCGSRHGARATRTGAWQSEARLEEIKRRYALGEISREQFEELKRNLAASQVPPAKEQVPSAEGVLK